ncbi:MAG: hypothetical protein EBZ48_02500 [Proteobacteria bacterium]|nr:hypothetical protein [Pseudomonadota bacterium]
MAAFSSDGNLFTELQKFLADPALNPPSIVERVNPLDTSISATLRGQSLDDLFRDALSGGVQSGNNSLESLSAFSLTRSTIESSRLGDEALRSELRGIVGGTPQLSDRELLERLSDASSEQRLTFLRHVLEYAEDNERALSFMREKLNNALVATSAEERATLANEVAKRVQTGPAGEFILELSRSAKSYDELCALVRCVGPETFMKSGNAALVDLLATAVLLQELQRIAGPQLKAAASANPVEQGKSLRGMVEELAAQVAAHPEYKSTQRYQYLLEQLRYDKLWLERELSSDKAPAELTVSLDTFKTRLALELRFGVLLRGQEAGEQPGIGLDDGPLPSHGVEWTMSELRSVEAALSGIPGVLLYSTPLLHEIQRVETLGSPYILGRRFEDGVVRLANSAVDLAALEILYPGCTSLQAVLTHELGHSVQLGLYAGTFVVSEEGLSFSDGDPRYDFKEYQGLAGWRILIPGQFKPTNGGLSVQIGTEEYPVERPVRFNGEDVIFTMRGGLLFVHKASGPFSLRDYSTTNPWEDFAEAFCEYTLRPDRLITFAPEKFKFLEQEFGRYKGDKELYKKLEHHLERKKANGSRNDR